MGDLEGLSGPAKKVPDEVVMPKVSLEYQIDDLLWLGIKHGASDLYIQSTRVPKFKINGKVVPCSQVDTEQAINCADALDPNQSQELLYSIMNDRQVLCFERGDELRGMKRHDLDIPYALKNADGTLRGFRVNIFHERKGIGGAIRILEPHAPRLSEVFSHDPGVAPLISGLLQRREGLVLLTGPTGSGKSTTIAAALQQHLDDLGGTLVTLEDPVEFYFTENNPSSVVIQRNIGEDTETFGDGIRAALREHPNLLLIGEMRDQTSVHQALGAALTGHVVVATLHTNSAKDSILRIANAVPESEKNSVLTNLSQCLIGIISQQLVPRKVPMTEGPLWTRERIAAAEVLLLDSAVRNQIASGRIEQIDNSIQTGGASGMRTRDKTLTDLMNNGIITLETAKAYARHPEMIRAL